MNRIRILLVDDQILFVNSLKIVISTLAPDMEVVGVAHNGHEAVAMIEDVRPDLMLVDVRMPVMDGVSTTKIVHDKYPRIKVMVLTTFNDDEYVHQAMQAGAEAYVLKDMPPEVLVTSIRAVNSGTILISPEVATKMFAEYRERVGNEGSRNRRTPPSIDLLTEREREILKLIADGLDNRGIAERLFLAEQSVKNRISDIYAKLGVHDRINAAKFLHDSR